MYAVAEQTQNHSIVSSKARYTLYVNLLETSDEVKAFCRKQAIRISHDSMQVCFTAKHDDLVLLITNYLAKDLTSARRLVSQLERTF